jgi:hypothetical protein
MPLHEAKSRFSHAEPGEGLNPPCRIGEAWDEPVTAEIPRLRDHELSRPIPRERPAPAPPPPPAPKLFTATSGSRAPKRRVRCPGSGEEWESASACAAAMENERRDAGIFKRVYPFHVIRAAERGCPLNGRLLTIEEAKP